MHEISNTQLMLCLFFSVAAVGCLILGVYLIVTGAPRARRCFRQLLCKHEWGEYACQKCGFEYTSCWWCGERYPTTKDCPIKPGWHNKSR